MATKASLFARAQSNRYSTNNDPFKNPNEVAKFSAYQYKRAGVPHSEALGVNGLQWTLSNATAEVVDGSHPLLASENYVFSSKHLTDAQRPLASEEYGFAAVRITATAVNGSARKSVGTMSFETQGLAFFRFVVKSANASSTGKFRLYSSVGNYREFAYTTSAAANTYTSISIDPLNDGTDTGTVDMDSINMIEWVVDTDGHSHDVYNWEAVQRAIQFTNSVVSMDLSHCVNEFTFNDETETVDVKCGNSIIDTKVTGRTLTIEFQSLNRNTFFEAISNSQLPVVSTDVDVQRLQNMTFDGSGNLDLSGLITNANELVNSTTINGVMVTITIGTGTGDQANLVLNPSTLVLSGGSFFANTSVSLHKYVQLSVAAFEKRQVMGYYGEFYLKKANNNSGYRTERFPRSSLKPVSTAYNQDGDLNTFMLHMYEASSDTSGARIYSKNFYLS